MCVCVWGGWGGGGGSEGVRVRGREMVGVSRMVGVKRWRGEWASGSKEMKGCRGEGVFGSERVRMRVRVRVSGRGVRKRLRGLGGE